jgi:outer membrane protein TolC
MKRWPPVALVLLALFLAPTPSTKAQKKEADESARKIKELQKERIATLKELVDQAAGLINAGKAGYIDLLDARRMLLKAELDATEKEAERITIWKNEVDRWKDAEKAAEKLKESGRGTATSVLRFKAMRLEAEIELERAKPREAKEKK